MWELLFGPSPDPGDVERWKNQKFDFYENTCILTQSQGGPCGVLAPVQAMLVQQIVHKVEDLKSVDPETRMNGLRFVLNRVLDRVNANSQKSPVILQLDSNNELVPSRLDICSLSLLEFAASVVATRTVEVVQSEMDDPSTCLIERFGHCSQELLNLMLIGKAVSNVFDREKSMGILLRGIPDDVEVDVGLLSELEHLRYVTVGSKLKNPNLPFWVLGSSTHYTLLFSFDKAVAYVPAKERVRERIMSKFTLFQLDEGLMDPENLNNLAAALHLPPPELPERNQLGQSGIVILDDFVSWAAPILLSRPEFAEQVVHSTKEFDQFYLINNQTPADVYSVKMFGSGGSSSPDPTLLAILHTRWPRASFVVNTI